MTTKKSERSDKQRREMLLNLMKQRGLKSSDIATILSVHKVSVRRWMCGMNPVPELSLKYLEMLYKNKAA